MFGRRKKKAPTPPPRSTATKLTDGGTAIDERVPKLSSRQSSVTSTTSNDSVGKPKKRTAPSPPTNTSIVNNERPGVISKKIQNVNVQQNSIDESRKNSSEITFSSFKQPPSQDNESKQVENGNERTKNNINGYMNHNGADAKAKEERFRLIPVESWEENEVLQWLASRKMQYFHELFSGCGIDGDYLMQITESDLVDLEVEEVDTRQQFITERDGLIRSRLKTSDSLGSDGNRGGSDHEEYEEEEEEDTNDDESMSDLDTGDDLSLPDLGVDDNTNRIKLRMSPPPSHGRLYEQLTLEPSLTWREKKMANWSEIDVQSWMESINLAQFVPQVKANKVTGNNLMNIDMKLLDSMGIEGDNLEVLLAKIYEINNPMANVPQKEFISAIDKVSGYDKEKFIAAVTVLQSSDSNGVQLLPSEAAPNTAPSSNSSRASSTKSSGSEKARRSDSEERKKKGGFSKLKEVITPWKRESKENSSVQIWSDLNETGCPTCVSIKVVDMTSALEVVKLCLEQLNKIEDPRLYSIVEVCISSADKDRLADRELGSEEYPLIVQNNWHNATSYHFELRQREAQGGTIKIVYRIAGHNPKGKLVNVSLSTPVNEVLALALKKFGMKNADPRLFCLLEVDKIGDVHHTTEDFIPLQSDSHAYVVCDKASVDEQFDLKDNDEGVDGLSVHRNDSMYSQASSKISNYSGASLGSSVGSDSLMPTINDEKLSRLEEEMANIEQSLLIKPKMKRVSSPEKITVSSTSTLSKTQEDMNELETYQKELHERETTIEVLRYENLRLQDKAKQLTVVQKALSQLEDAFQQHEKEVKNRKKLDRSYQADESIDSSQLAIKDLETRLDQVGQDIRLKESRIKQLHQQMNDETDNKETNNESTEREAELEYKLAMEESTLVALKQQQASLLSRLELAKADQEVAAEKARSKRQRAPVFPMLSSKQHNRLVTMQIKKGVNGYGFSLTTRTDQKGVYIHTCDSKGIMKVGDRLYEINGENVLRMPISQVNTRLNGMHQVQLVLLRTEEEEDTLEKSRAAIKMKEELRTLKEQVQITKTENKRLSEDVQRLVELEDRAAEADKLRIIVNELQSRLSNKDSHCNALSEQVKEIPVIRGSLKQRQKELERLEMQRNSFEAETVQLSEEITRMKSTSEYKDELIEKLTRERDMALHELNEVTTHKSNRLRAVDGMDDVPLWEALKGSSKTEILEVFRAESLEASRQKQYLDQLYSLMLENAPQLLGNLEQELDASGLSGDEEFC